MKNMNEACAACGRRDTDGRCGAWCALLNVCVVTFLTCFCLTGCEQKKPADNGAFATAREKRSGSADLQDIIMSGELIVATLSGPDTYYDYQGQPMGLQYALAADFAGREGLRVRMETAHDTTELVNMLLKGDVDLVALPLPSSLIQLKGLLAAGFSTSDGKNAWAVRDDAPQLAQALRDWNAAKSFETVERQEKERFRERKTVRRHVRAPYVSRQKGIISAYDEHFRRAAVIVGWDWRLIAAQCYQESCFDPAAVSWAGARGLMQIMPGTARGLGVSPDALYAPDINIGAAARFLQQLNGRFSDIRNGEERICFVLAAYNAGPGHVRDAMALARKYGKDMHRWADVAYFVQRLGQSRYYRDPVVRYGYMIGSETYGYVSSVIDRWRAYGGAVGSVGHTIGESGGGGRVPHKRNRFSKEQKIYTPEELARGAGKEN